MENNEHATENVAENEKVIDKKGTRKRLTHDLTLMGISTALLAVSAWISIPLIVSITLQTFAVCLIAALLGWKRGTLSLLAYLAIGAIGLPVFTGFKSGVAVLLGPTGGYLIGFIFMSLIIGGAANLFGRKYLPLIVSSVLGLLVCYAFGTAWFIIVYTGKGNEITVLQTLSMCVFPFILPDTIKLGLGIVLAERLHRILKGRFL